MNELTKPNQPIDIIQAAISGNASPEVLERLFLLKKDYEAHEAKKAFDHDFSRLQGNLPAVVRSKQAYGYKYAPIEEILYAVRPVLCQFGFGLLFDVSQDDKLVTAYCVLTHSGGHEYRTSVTVPIVGIQSSGGKNVVNPAQQIGIAVTYAKRYALMNALGIEVVDNERPSNDTDGVAVELLSVAQREELKAAFFNASDDAKAEFKARYSKFTEVPASEFDALIALAKGENQ